MADMKLSTVVALVSNDQISSLEASFLRFLFGQVPASVGCLVQTPSERRVRPFTVDRQVKVSLA